MRPVAPIVTTDWLAGNIDRSELVIIDIRVAAEYTAGHIPRAVNIPFPDAIENPASQWFVERDGLLLELPETKELFNTIGSAGISNDSIVIIVPKRELPHPLVDATRAADVLLYAGLKNMAILDGGYEKWRDEGRPVSDAIVKPSPVTYAGEVDDTLFVSKEYVKERIGKAVFIDAREPLAYFGCYLMPLSYRPGHIPTAKCLPSLWIWQEDKTYRPISELKEMVAGVVGTDMSQEIVIYCVVGGFSSAWLFVLKEVLGYTNVKIYHGAAQEWTRDPEAPLVLYRWE